MFKQKTLTRNVDVIFQFETARLYLRLGRELSNSSTTHGTKQGISSNKFHAAESESRSSYDGSSCILLGTHETFSDLSQRKQRSIIETGTDILINKLLPC